MAPPNEHRRNYSPKFKMATPMRRCGGVLKPKAHILVLGVEISLSQFIHNAKWAFCTGHTTISASYTYVRSSVAIGLPWCDPVRLSLMLSDTVCVCATPQLDAPRMSSKWWATSHPNCTCHVHTTRRVTS